MFNFKKDMDGYWKWFGGNLASGDPAVGTGIAGLYRGFNISCVGIIVYCGLYFGMYDLLKPVLLAGSLQDSFFASFALGWLITNGAGLASYPIDTVRRRMMVTSGEVVKYKSSLDAFSQIMKNEGAKSLFKGAGANILRAIAGASVLAGYDKLQLIVLGRNTALMVVRACSLLFVYSLDYAHTPLANDAKAAKKVYRGLYFGMYYPLKPVLLTGSLQDSFFASFAWGWLITNGAGLASYRIDTVRRKMMMTTGEVVKYKSSLDAFSQIMKNEGANILSAIAGAGVLAGYDKLQLIVFGKKYGSDGA
ncbi:hypothetical protein OPV22_024373 [Ensete ventricosum]|uniref:ADP/ATP translocase n=1 Tax=Ensete ventricosum TaxID=4639 RepID=A0AAV8PGA8_ENSVE|nr:hypothetical protein OPV22_024373 [Ensete ventricosum]